MKKLILHCATIGFLLGPMNCAAEAPSPETEKDAMKTSASAQSADAGQKTSSTNGRERLHIQVDVAAITVRFVDMDTDYRVRWRKDASCDRIEVSESRSGLDIRHSDSDQHCGGSRIELDIRSTLATQLRSGAGSIVVKDTGKLLSHARSLTSEVTAGSISSEISAIHVSRRWAQASAEYSSDNRSGIDVAIALSAGSIAFYR